VLVITVCFRLFTYLAGIVIIDPAGDGGFENGSTFAANGWTVVNDNINQWYVGTLVASSGNGAYISDTGGSTYHYNYDYYGHAQASHFYRDVTIPTGLSGELTFQWKGRGDLYKDRLLVYLASTSVIPVAATPGDGMSWIENAELLGNYWGQSINQYATETLYIHTPGTYRLIFTWVNDTSMFTTTQTPAAVDNISLITYSRNPISGTQIIGAAGTPYLTFTAAFNALNKHGVTSFGATFWVAGGNYYENPPALKASGTAIGPIVFAASPTGGSVTLRPSTGWKSYGFVLRGADHVRFDAIDVYAPGTSSTDNHLRAYWLEALAGNGCSHNVIQNCTITMATWQSANQFPNFGITSMGTDNTPNTHNSFLSNIITGPYNGICSIGFEPGFENDHEEAYANTVSWTSFQGIAFIGCTNGQIGENDVSYSFPADISSPAFGIRVEGYAGGNFESCEVYYNTINGSYASNQWSAGIYAAEGYHYLHHNQILYLGSSNSAAPLYGIYAPSGSLSLNRNTITGLSGGNTVYGISCGSIVTANGSKIYNLSSSGTDSIVAGISLADNTMGTVMNSMVYDLRNPGSYVAPQIRCIETGCGGTLEIWFNTLYLDASGTAANFSSAIIYAQDLSATTIDVRNNILDNRSVCGTAGKTVAFWKLSPGNQHLASSTGRNIYQGGGEPSAQNLIAWFGGTGYEDLVAYKMAVFPIDIDSFGDAVPYVDNSMPGYDLHLQTSIPTVASNNALPIPNATLDIDAEPRLATPDIGADEGDFMDESDVPGDVVIFSPEIGATNVDPNNVTLIWIDPFEGGYPYYYRVDIYAYINGVPVSYQFDVYFPGYSLDLSAQPGVDLGYGNHWNWSVMAMNTFGQSGYALGNFTTMTEPGLATPDVSISQSAGTINLDWQDVPGAACYLIYASSDPFASTYSYLGYTVPSQYSLASDTRQFFRVVASSQIPGKEPGPVIIGAQE